MFDIWSSRVFIILFNSEKSPEDWLFKLYGIFVTASEYDACDVLVVGCAGEVYETNSCEQ